jgi:hypothetical protein
MTIQSILNNNAITMLPKTSALINQSKHKGLSDLVLNRILVTKPCLDEKTVSQLKSFDAQMYNLCMFRIKENEELSN